MNKENFGFEENLTGNQAGNLEDKTDLDTGNISNERGEDLDNNSNKDSNNSNANKDNGGSDKPNVSSTGDGQEQEEVSVNDLEEGTILTIEDTDYTVDKDGNLLDDKGNIFKTKDEVSEMLKNNNVVNAEEDENTLSIDNIQKTLGINITDENNQPVEFDNTPEGVASYVNSVVDLKRDEFAQAGINKLIEDFPIVKDFLDYYIANGNSYEGFGEMPDRSNIEVDEKNEAQQMAIIREAAKEFNKRGDTEKYIAYLKDSGQLLDVAKAELQALKEADAEMKEANAKEASRIQAEQEQELYQYWQGVKSCIDNREIAGYKIPETIIIEKDGKKISTTPDDFFNYIYQVDEEGYSRYQRELANESFEKRRDDELLKAWLKYTGKTYNSLVEMAVNKKEIKKLKLAAANNKTTKNAIKITKPHSKGSITSEDFGY